MITAALNGTLAQVPTGTDPFFGVQIPQTCPDVPPEVLQPRKTWKDPQAYDAQARKLAGMFTENFKQFANDASPDIRAAGPRSA
jgi:phosphoenolpyruvate carboxykinase (ATP)